MTSTTSSRSSARSSRTRRRHDGLTEHELVERIFDGLFEVGGAGGLRLAARSIVTALSVCSRCSAQPGVRPDACTITL